MTAAIRREVTEHGCSRELAERMARRFGWRGSLRAHQIRLAQMLSGTGERRFPVDALPDVVEITRSSAVLGPATTALFRAAAAEIDDLRAERPPMARIAPQRGRDRKRA